MMKKLLRPIHYYFLIPYILISLYPVAAFPQEDIMGMLDQNTENTGNVPVTATFKTTRIINAQSTECAPKGAMDVRITHRFGNIGAASGGGFKSFYGLDKIANIRLAVEYGILDNLMIGIGRSKTLWNIDAFVKYRFLTQTTNNKIPLSMAVYLNAAVSPIRRELFYADVPVYENNNLHRLSYVAQIIVARKFGKIGSLEILPTYVHRNFVRAYINPNNGAEETNGLFSLGAAAKICLTERQSVLVEYFYTFSKFRQDNPTHPYYNPISIGYEIETGGHVFHINFTNAVGITENDFIPYSPDTWKLGGFKWGFNISRVFQF